MPVHRLLLSPPWPPVQPGQIVLLSYLPSPQDSQDNRRPDKGLWSLLRLWELKEEAPCRPKVLKPVWPMARKSGWSLKTDLTARSTDKTFICIVPRLPAQLLPAGSQWQQNPGLSLPAPAVCQSGDGLPSSPSSLPPYVSQALPEQKIFVQRCRLRSRKESYLSVQQNK